MTLVKPLGTQNVFYFKIAVVFSKLYIQPKKDKIFFKGLMGFKNNIQTVG